jgi:hypothetical protein
MSSVPTFSGKPDEDFDLWKSRVEALLGTITLDESMKISAVNLAVCGNARRVLLDKRFNKAQDIFDLLKDTFSYKIQSVDTLHALKQLENEQVKVFATRVKHEISLLGIAQGKFFEETAMSVFIKGLRPELAQHINIVQVSSFEQAIEHAARAAILVENQPNHPRSISQKPFYKPQFRQMQSTSPYSLTGQKNQNKAGDYNLNANESNNDRHQRSFKSNAYNNQFRTRNSSNEKSDYSRKRKVIKCFGCGQ